MTLFVILAAAMLVVALAFSLLPMLRQRAPSASANDSGSKRLKALKDAHAAGVINDEEFKSKLAGLAASDTSAALAKSRRPALLASLLVALLLPAGAIVLYQAIGAPNALNPDNLVARSGSAPAGTGADGQGIEMDEAIAGLVAKLEANPDNAEGWALLGRAYQAMGKFAESRDALKQAFDIQPDNHDLTVEYAQALALSGEGRRITGESRQLIEGVLAADPEHQRALWLIGISDYQSADYDAAIRNWNRLLPALPPDSDIARSVRAQIADAEQLGGANPAGTAMATAPAVAPSTASAAGSAAADSGAAGGPGLTIEVSLDDSLKSKLEFGSTLFVFARAESGPPMPLAIQRLQASDLPLTVRLDDSMGMLPSMKLSMFPKVVVGARISASGNALPQSGDLQVLSGAIDVNRKEPLSLVIDSVIP
ncbi:c-type cytochrome biogenesis protein CcmI [Dokdonella sp.]|uniref:c-type cytochrome biogenesis protein CcmI n=1 Tax=Dokdonella sp. TaxID=2291710 RepID=UPI003C69B223